jgi:hypothetical protein
MKREYRQRFVNRKMKKKKATKRFITNTINEMNNTTKEKKKN